MKSNKKEAAILAEKIKIAIEQGEMTLNQARNQVGLEPIDDPMADELIKKE